MQASTHIWKSGVIRPLGVTRREVLLIDKSATGKKASLNSLDCLAQMRYIPKNTRLLTTVLKDSKDCQSADVWGLKTHPHKKTETNHVFLMHKFSQMDSLHSGNLSTAGDTAPSMTSKNMGKNIL